MKALNLVFAIFIGALLGIYACSEDDELDPNVFCDENACSTDGDLKKECIDAFNNCMATEPDANDDECAATALLICKL